MKTNRLEAFSDGVIAIIITIMVLELKVPHGSDWSALYPLIPKFLAYLLSFAYLAIYWNNHHHMLAATETVSGKILWANMHLLFWLSLVPFVTAWAGETKMATVPAASYSVVLLMSAISYKTLQTSIVKQNGPNSPVAKATQNDVKGLGSIMLYIIALGAAFWKPEISIAIYIVVAVIWMIPDRRIELNLEP